MNTEAMPAPRRRPSEWYLDHLTTDVDRFATVLRTAPADLPVPACPGWDVRRLAEHLGQIHRWADFCASHARPPTADEVAELESEKESAIGPGSIEPDRLADWLRDGADRLAATLRDLDPAGPTWHPFPVERVAAVWPRRQANETAMHRWDAERAAGLDTSIDAELASDGIDEYFEIAIPRLLVREQIDVPSGSLHVHCTDVDGEWLVWSEAGEYRMIRAHRKGDAALRGPASSILLRLWGRDGEHTGDLNPVGDAEVLDAWLSIAGM